MVLIVTILFLSINALSEFKEELMLQGYTKSIACSPILVSTEVLQPFTIFNIT